MSQHSPSSGERKGNSPNRSNMVSLRYLYFGLTMLDRGCKAVSLVLREKLQNVCIEKVVGNQHHSG